MSSQHQEGCQTLSRQQPQQQTGGEIGAEGAGTLGEALKVNTTLTLLRLYGVQQQQDNAKQAHNINLNDKTGNESGSKVSAALREALKDNTTLTTLDPGSEHSTPRRSQTRTKHSQQCPFLTNKTVDYENYEDDD